MKKNLKRLILTCDCAVKKSGVKPCGKLQVLNFGNGDFEIEGVFLKPKSINKLLAFILRAKVGMLKIKVEDWGKKQ